MAQQLNFGPTCMCLLQHPAYAVSLDNKIAGFLYAGCPIS
jgi:hypothetical protein